MANNKHYDSLLGLIEIEKEQAKKQQERELKKGNGTLGDARDIETEIAKVLSHQDGSHGFPLNAIFCGGQYNGRIVTHEQLMKMGNGKFSLRWSQLPEWMHNKDRDFLETEDQPEVDGYLGPMKDGNRLRYICGAFSMTDTLSLTADF